MNDILIGICDESDMDRELFMQYLRLAESTLELTFEIHTYTAGNHFLNEFRPVYDILFLTLPLSDISPETLLSQIRLKDSEVNIILLADSLEYCHLGYEYNAEYYFHKPLRYFKLLDVLKQILSDHAMIQRPYLWLSNHQGIFRLYHRPLRYIETNNRQLRFHYGNHSFLQNGSLNEIEQQLPNHTFFRCNSSYIVNMNYIQKIVKDINRYSIYLLTGEILPLSRSKKKALGKILYKKIIIHDAEESSI